MAGANEHRWLLIIPYTTLDWDMVSAEKKNLFPSILVTADIQAALLPSPPALPSSVHFHARSLLAKHPICSSVAFQSRRCSGDLVLINSCNIIHEPVCERRRRTGRWCQSELNQQGLGGSFPGLGDHRVSIPQILPVSGFFSSNRVFSLAQMSIWKRGSLHLGQRQTSETEYLPWKLEDFSILYYSHFHPVATKYSHKYT